MSSPEGSTNEPRYADPVAGAGTPEAFGDVPSFVTEADGPEEVVVGVAVVAPPELCADSFGAPGGVTVTISGTEVDGENAASPP